jgi:uncharacterized protein (UPF0147 family)
LTVSINGFTWALTCVLILSSTISFMVASIVSHISINRNCQKATKNTITEQEQTLLKHAAIITTLQTIAKDHTLALKEHSTEVDALYNKIKELESRIESQEQYSRRSSLRFHNIKVSVDERGNVKHPVYTDELILNVCNNKLGLDINLHDIGRSHIIGKVKDGKSQVIVRFVPYRTRTKVHSNKKGLKNQPSCKLISSPSLLLHTLRISSFVLKGCLTFPLSSTDTLLLWKRMLLHLEYCS